MAKNEKELDVVALNKLLTMLVDNQAQYKKAIENNAQLLEIQTERIVMLAAENLKEKIVELEKKRPLNLTARSLGSLLPKTIHEQ
jgi:hypothetical protein